jgi:hypothetical protein
MSKKLNFARFRGVPLLDLWPDAVRSHGFWMRGNTGLGPPLAGVSDARFALIFGFQLDFRCIAL